MTKVLLAYSWGHQFPKPGLSNEVMAQEISRLKETFDYVLVQQEIADALRPYKVFISAVIGDPGVYINTYEVTEAMVAWMKAHQIDPRQSDIFIVCHATHWAGCKLVLRKFDISARRLPINVPYDRNSLHWYTRTPGLAFLGKIVHGVSYLLRGQL